MEDPGDNPISDALNQRTKYVASTSLTDPEWANTEVLAGDVPAAVRELEANTGPDQALGLTEAQVTGNGVTIQVYRPAGRPEYRGVSGRELGA